MTVRAELDVATDDGTMLDVRARRLAQPVRDAGITGAEHVVVHVGPQRLAVPACQIRHVVGPRPITAAPATSDAIVGLAAVDGQVVAAIDLAVMLRVIPAAPPRDRHLVLLGEHLDALALLVDSVERVQVFPALDGAADEALGVLTSDAGEGVRLLHLDALLAVLDPPDTRPADTTGGLS